MTDNRSDLWQRIRPLLDISAPRDGLAVHYAFYHEEERTRLFVEERDGRTEGFLAICQTGQDLFRQLVVVRARYADAAEALLRRELVPRRPYYIVTTPDLGATVGKVVEVERAGIHRIYCLDLRNYRPHINVLVVPAPTADGSPRFVIRSGEEIAAASGVNWNSPHFAEIYVWVAPEARGRGWGKAVVESCVAWVVRSGAQPLYTVAEENKVSIRLAESMGFVDTGAREFTVEGVLRTDK